MLSLSATATHGVKGWNLTTEGTPGFLLRNIWSSSLAIPAQRDTQRWASTYSTRDDVVLARPKPRLPFGDLGGHGGTQAKQVSDEKGKVKQSTEWPRVRDLPLCGDPGSFGPPSGRPSD